MTLKRADKKNIAAETVNDDLALNKYFDLYKSSKITVDELRKFEELNGMSDNELEKLSDNLFDLAVLTMRIINDENTQVNHSENKG